MDLSNLQHNHVVYIITKLELGGAQKVCLALMQGLEDHKIPATLISGADGILVPETKRFDSVILLPTLTREIRLRCAWLEIKNFVLLIKYLRQLKKQHGPLIVHTHSTKAGFIGRWAAFFAGIRWSVHTIHGYGFHEHQSYLSCFAIYLCELVTSFITTHFICVSMRDQSTGCRLFPRFAKKSSLIRAAIDQGPFLLVKSSTRIAFEKKVNNEPLTIGTISCFKPQKNLLDLLKAFKEVYYSCIEENIPSPTLHIIGDGILRNEIESWLSAEQLEQVVQLFGWQKNIIPLMKTWHIFALSSLWEGLPCAVIEARLCHIPVVAYDVGGIAEVIRNGSNGFLEHPGHWQGLAKHLFAIMKNKELRQQLSAYKDHLEDFDTKNMVEKHVTLYYNLSAKSQQL